MADIIRYLLIALVIIALYKIAFFTVKRCGMLRKIYSLRRECNAKITLHRFPFLPHFVRSKKPDITVEIFDTVYHIRLYSGISGTHLVHFVDGEYSVVYRQMRAMTTPARAAVKTPSHVRLTYSQGGKVRIISHIDTDGCTNSQKRTVPVLLFSPAPYEVSYVTEERSTIKLAFTGDSLYGYKIFTPSTFAIHADREARASKSRVE